jgi:hypothetical protein
MRRRSFVILACLVIAAGCGRDATPPAVTAPSFDHEGSAHSCLAPDSIQTLIRNLFRGRDRSAALSRFGQILRKLDPTPPGPDTSAARVHALRLVDFVVKKYTDGQLTGGTSDPTRRAVIQLLNGILCTVGLPQTFGPGAFTGDDAAQVIFPTSPTTVVLTGTEWAGVEIQTGSVSEPTLVQITRLPDSPGPLLTPFDQYPLFYEYTATPAGAFLQDVVVGTCLLEGVQPPDPTRLRLAHNVPPFTPGSIEILPLAAAPFLDCTDAGLAAAPPSGWMELAGGGARLLRAALAALAPRPAYAATYFGAGLGGTVRTFSPFGAVDTLGIATRDAPIEQGGAPFASLVPPAMILTTPTGRPMEGVPVQFVLSGPGTLTGGNAVSDATGRAAAEAWSLGIEGMSTVQGTAVAPAGAGFTGSPMLFYGFVRR